MGRQKWFFLEKDKILFVANNIYIESVLGKCYLILNKI